MPKYPNTSTNGKQEKALDAETARRVARVTQQNAGIVQRNSELAIRIAEATARNVELAKQTPPGTPVPVPANTPETLIPVPTNADLVQQFVDNGCGPLVEQLNSETVMAKFSADPQALAAKIANLPLASQNQIKTIVDAG